MRVLFAANELHFPDNMGGSRMDIHDLALTLQEQGHDVAVLAALRGRNRLLGYRVLETLTGRCLLHRVDTGTATRPPGAGPGRSCASSGRTWPAGRRTC